MSSSSTPHQNFATPHIENHWCKTRVQPNTQLYTKQSVDEQRQNPCFLQKQFEAVLVISCEGLNEVELK